MKSKSVLPMLIAAMVIAGLTSCGLFEKKSKQTPSGDSVGAELRSSDIKQMEYYRGYIAKNLPFKQIRWEAVFSGEKVRQMSRYGDSFYVETNAHRFYSLNSKTGFRQWQLQLPGPIDYFISTVGDLPKKEAELRKSLVTVEKEISSESKSKDRDEDKIKSLKRQLQALQQEFISLRLRDVLYLTCKGSLYCIDRSVGTILWQAQLEFVPGTAPCATIASVFIGSLDVHRVYQVDTTLRYEKDWFKIAEPVNTTPLYENLILYFGSQDGKVYAYDTVEHKLLWSYQTEKSIVADMILDGDILYVPSADFAIYGIDRYAGILLWKFETGSAVTTPMRVDKMVTKTVIPVKAPAAEAGSEGAENPAESAPVKMQDTISRTLYAYSDNNGLYALDLITTSVIIKDEDPSRPDREKIMRRANPRWKFEDGRDFLIRGQKRIYVTGLDNRTLYALGTGERLDVKEKYDLSYFPARFGDLTEGILYLATPDGYLFSVKEP
ncbi:MAG: PQQ-binding-like beta-propeller repeat protein [Planctomycetes bacterium]|nr:PQQ-binding-like beta-propeller repeat protein [Planctomycetota bacterium]